MDKLELVKIAGDGTKLSGVVSDEENKPPRECHNCYWYQHDLCHHPIVMIDPEVIGEDGEPKPVGDKWCCNFFRNWKRVLLYVVRHGQTELNAGNAYRGWEDVLLDAQGKKDAKEVGEFLRKRGIRWIVTSDLKRAVETADTIAKVLGIDPDKVYKDYSLRPWNVGELAGQEKTKENEALLDEYVDNPHWDIPGGESLEAFGDRIQEAIRFYFDKGREDGIGVIVTHTSDVIQFNDYCKGEGPAGRPESADIVDPGGALCIVKSQRMTDSKPKFECTAVFKEKEETAEYGAS